MWHVSIAVNPNVGRPSKDEILEQALRVLRGVGDAHLGEWSEWGNAFHLRRRLSAKEQERVGVLRDVRGTPEAKARLDAVRQWLPKGWTE